MQITIYTVHALTAHPDHPDLDVYSGTVAHKGMACGDPRDMLYNFCSELPYGLDVQDAIYAALLQITDYSDATHAYQRADDQDAALLLQGYGIVICRNTVNIEPVTVA